MKVEFFADGRVAQCTFDDLTNYDLDQKGYSSTLGLQDVLLASRYLGWFAHFVEKYALTSQSLGIFVRAQRLVIHPSFYSRFSPKLPAMDTLRIVHVGRTSLVIRQDLQMKEAGDLIATAFTQAVLVNLNTRRSSPLPESYTRSFSDVMKLPRPVIFDDQPDFETQRRNRYDYKVVVAHEDTDFYKHAQYDSYIKYCIDCARFGARQRAYSAIQDDLSAYSITEMSIQYLNESVLNDELLVTSCEDKSNPHKIHFSIKKHGRQIVLCTISFGVTILLAKM
ncbi:uncharacterized protein [Ptychodera flava]|uniref:uncharacterized protein n=1 Tax=Ptychodera flava TaxID=63121 RepID=UPI00396A81B0